MIETQRPKHHRWADIPAEPMKGSITRKIVTGEKMMIAEIFLAKGDVVPAHRHHNEQIVHILSGALKLRLGEEQQDEVVVRGGEVLVIPGNVLHSAEALEDTIDVDIFAPPREDWLDGSDAYLRQG
jgi:quercetin dioxygenase-like cupin family protein